MESVKQLKTSLEKNVQNERQLVARLVVIHRLFERNGILLTKNGHKSHKWFQNPYICLTISAIFTLRDFTSLVVNQEWYSLLMGDLGVGPMKIVFNIYCFISWLFFVLSMLLHFNYYERGKKNYMITMDLEPLWKVAQSIDWKGKLIVGLFKCWCNCAISFLIFYQSYNYYQYLSTEDYLRVGILWSLLWSSLGICCLSLFFYQLLMSLTVCGYYQNKLRQINLWLQLLSHSNKSDLRRELRAILSDMNALHRDIEECDQFWSKFYLFNWVYLSCGLTADSITAIFFLKDLDIISVAYLIYDFLNFLIYFAILIKTCVVIHTEANNSYKHLNHFVVNNQNKLTVDLKIKVGLTWHGQINFNDSISGVDYD